MIVDGGMTCDGTERELAVSVLGEKLTLPVCSGTDEPTAAEATGSVSLTRSVSSGQRGNRANNGAES